MAEEKTPQTPEEEKDVEGHGPYAPTAEPTVDREASLEEDDDVEGHSLAAPTAKPTAKPTI
jgi:hypothetical protein